MAADRFATILPITLKWEGGNDDDPVDPGGRTSRGVTQARYDEYRRDERLARRDVWKATDAEVRAIYERYYWRPMRCADLPPGVDLAVFDAGVNSGPARGGKWLRQALGRGNATAVPTIDDIAVANAVDTKHLAARICDLRLSFVRSLRTFWRFGKGWTRRIADIRARAMAMAGASADALTREAAAQARAAADTSRGAAASGVGSGAATTGAIATAPVPTPPPEIVPAPEAAPDLVLTWSVAPWLCGVLALALLMLALWLAWRAGVHRHLAEAAREVADELREHAR